MPTKGLTPEFFQENWDFIRNNYSQEELQKSGVSSFDDAESVKLNEIRAESKREYDSGSMLTPVLDLSGYTAESAFDMLSDAFVGLGLMTGLKSPRTNAERREEMLSDAEREARYSGLMGDIKSTATDWLGDFGGNVAEGVAKGSGSAVGSIVPGLAAGAALTALAPVIAPAASSATIAAASVGLYSAVSGLVSAASQYQESDLQGRESPGSDAFKAGATTTAFTAAGIVGGRALGSVVQKAVSKSPVIQNLLKNPEAVAAVMAKTLPTVGAAMSKTSPTVGAAMSKTSPTVGAAMSKTSPTVGSVIANALPKVAGAVAETGVEVVSEVGEEVTQKAIIDGKLMSAEELAVVAILAAGMDPVASFGLKAVEKLTPFKIATITEDAKKNSVDTAAAVVGAALSGASSAAVAAPVGQAFLNKVASVVDNKVKSASGKAPAATDVTAPSATGVTAGSSVAPVDESLNTGDVDISLEDILSPASGSVNAENSGASNPSPKRKITKAPQADIASSNNWINPEEEVNFDELTKERDGSDLEEKLRTIEEQKLADAEALAQEISSMDEGEKFFNQAIRDNAEAQVFDVLAGIEEDVSFDDVEYEYFTDGEDVSGAFDEVVDEEPASVDEEPASADEEPASADGAVVENAPASVEGAAVENAPESAKVSSSSVPDAVTPVSGVKTESVSEPVKPLGESVVEPGSDKAPMTKAVSKVVKVSDQVKSDNELATKIDPIPNLKLAEGIEKNSYASNIEGDAAISQDLVKRAEVDLLSMVPDLGLSGLNASTTPNMKLIGKMGDPISFSKVPSSAAGHLAQNIVRLIWYGKTGSDRALNDYLYEFIRSFFSFVDPMKGGSANAKSDTAGASALELGDTVFAYDIQTKSIVPLPLFIAEQVQAMKDSDVMKVVPKTVNKSSDTDPDAKGTKRVGLALANAFNRVAGDQGIHPSERFIFLDKDGKHKLLENRENAAAYREAMYKFYKKLEHANISFMAPRFEHQKKLSDALNRISKHTKEIAEFANLSVTFGQEIDPLVKKLGDTTLSESEREAFRKEYEKKSAQFLVKFKAAVTKLLTGDVGKLSGDSVKLVGGFVKKASDMLGVPKEETEKAREPFRLMKAIEKELASETDAVKKAKISNRLRAARSAAHRSMLDLANELVNRLDYSSFDPKSADLFKLSNDFIYGFSKQLLQELKPVKKKLLSDLMNQLKTYGQISSKKNNMAFLGYGGFAKTSVPYFVKDSEAGNNSVNSALLKLMLEFDRQFRNDNDRLVKPLQSAEKRFVDAATGKAKTPGRTYIDEKTGMNTLERLGAVQRLVEEFWASDPSTPFTEVDLRDRMLLPYVSEGTDINGRKWYSVSAYGEKLGKPVVKSFYADDAGSISQITGIENLISAMKEANAFVSDALLGKYSVTAESDPDIFNKFKSAVAKISKLNKGVVFDLGLDIIGLKPDDMKNFVNRVMADKTFHGKVFRQSVVPETGTTLYTSKGSVGWFARRTLKRLSGGDSRRASSNAVASPSQPMDANSPEASNIREKTRQELFIENAAKMLTRHRKKLNEWIRSDRLRNSLNKPIASLLDFTLNDLINAGYFARVAEQNLDLEKLAVSILLAQAKRLSELQGGGKPDFRRNAKEAQEILLHQIDALKGDTSEPEIIAEVRSGDNKTVLFHIVSAAKHLAQSVAGIKNSFTDNLSKSWARIGPKSKYGVKTIDDALAKRIIDNIADPEKKVLQEAIINISNKMADLVNKTVMNNLSQEPYIMLTNSRGQHYQLSAAKVHELLTNMVYNGFLYKFGVSGITAAVDAFKVIHLPIMMTENMALDLIDFMSGLNTAFPPLFGSDPVAGKNSVSSNSLGTNLGSKTRQEFADIYKKALDKANGERPESNNDADVFTPPLSSDTAVVMESTADHMAQRPVESHIAATDPGVRRRGIKMYGANLYQQIQTGVAPVLDTKDEGGKFLAALKALSPDESAAIAALERRMKQSGKSSLQFYRYLHSIVTSPADAQALGSRLLRILSGDLDAIKTDPNKDEVDISRLKIVAGAFFQNPALMNMTIAVFGNGNLDTDFHETLHLLEKALGGSFDLGQYRKRFISPDLTIEQAKNTPWTVAESEAFVGSVKDILLEFYADQSMHKGIIRRLKDFMFDAFTILHPFMPDDVFGRMFVKKYLQSRQSFLVRNLKDQKRSWMQEFKFAVASRINSKWTILEDIEEKLRASGRNLNSLATGLFNNAKSPAKSFRLILGSTSMVREFFYSGVDYDALPDLMIDNPDFPPFAAEHRLGVMTHAPIVMHGLSELAPDRKLFSKFDAKKLEDESLQEMVYNYWRNPKSYRAKVEKQFNYGDEFFNLLEQGARIYDQNVLGLAEFARRSGLLLSADAVSKIEDGKVFLDDVLYKMVTGKNLSNESTRDFVKRLEVLTEAIVQASTKNRFHLNMLNPFLSYASGYDFVAMTKYNSMVKVISEPVYRLMSESDRKQVHSVRAYEGSVPVTRHFYYTDKEVAKLMDSIVRSDTATRLFFATVGAITNEVKRMIISFPAFILGQIPKDFFESSMNTTSSKTGFFVKYLQQLSGGLINAVHHRKYADQKSDEISRARNASGAGFGDVHGFRNVSEQLSEKFIGHILYNNPDLRFLHSDVAPAQYKRIVQNFLSFFPALAMSTNDLVYNAQYAQSLEEFESLVLSNGKAPVPGNPVYESEKKLYATLNSIELMDFAKMGYWMEDLNEIFMFSASAFRASVRMIESLKQRGDQYVSLESSLKRIAPQLLSLGLMMTLPQFLLMGVVGKDRYDTYSYQLRDSSLIFPVGGTELRLPQGYGWTAASAGAVRSVDKFAFGNDKAFTDYGKTVATSFFPFNFESVGAPFRGVIDALFNHNSRFGGPVSRDLDEKKRKGEQTALIEVVSDSKSLDYMLRQTFPYWGTLIANQLRDMRPNETRFSRFMSDLTGFFVLRSPYTYPHVTDVLNSDKYSSHDRGRLRRLLESWKQIDGQKDPKLEQEYRERIAELAAQIVKSRR